MISKAVETVKDGRGQRPVPNEWRPTIRAIVHALLSTDDTAISIPNVLPVPSEQRVRMSGNINDYGANLIELPEETWETSVCQWMGAYALIDLFTLEEGRSDLALSVRVKDVDGQYRFEVMSIHVP